MSAQKDPLTIDCFLEAGLAFSRKLYSKRILGKHYRGEILGVNRLGYSVEEREAIVSIIKECEDMNLEVYQDLAGNVFLVYPGKERKAPVVLIGSHVDAVKNGGQFDGTAGVVAALAALKIIQKASIAPPRDVVVVIWRCEESPTFKQFGIGSGLAVGAFDGSILDHCNDRNKTLARAISETYVCRSQHYKERGARLRKIIDSKNGLLPRDAIACALEIHIEQSDELLRSQKSLGVVSGIRGNIRFPSINFSGRGQHTGGGYMPDRQDTSLMLAHFMSLAVTEINLISQNNQNDIVYSFPIIEQENNSSTTTPSHTRIAFEARSVQATVLEEVQDIIITSARKAAKRNRGVESIGEVNMTSPSIMSQWVQSKILKALKKLDVSTLSMISGAGHDIMRLSSADIPTGLVFIRHGGLSHNPKENLSHKDDPFVSNSDFANAVRLVASLMVSADMPVRTIKDTFVQGLINRGAERIHL